MTIADYAAGRSNAHVRWREVEDGFWVAQGTGRFVGTVERRGARRFLARDSVRSTLGEYPTLASATAAVLRAEG